MNNYVTANGEHKTLGIVVPVFNTEEQYLIPCLDSLVQSCNDYRVVVVDDGSSHKTHDLLCQYVAVHNGLMSLITQTNAGQNAARNTGCNAANADYIMFVDSDDMLVPDSINTIVSALVERHPDILLFDIAGDGDAGRSNVQHICMSVPPKRALLTEQCSLWGLAIASPQIQAIPLLEDVHIGEDFGSVFPLIAHSQDIFKIDAGLYRYTQRETSIINSQEYKYPLEILRAFDRLLTMEWLLPFRRELEWQAIKHLLFWEPLRLLRSGTASKANKAILCAYMHKHFPNWKSNKYYLENRASYGADFHLLTEGHWRLYYACWSVKRTFTELRSMSKR